MAGAAVNIVIECLPASKGPLDALGTWGHPLSVALASYTCIAAVGVGNATFSHRGYGPALDRGRQSGVKRLEAASRSAGGGCAAPSTGRLSDKHTCARWGRSLHWVIAAYATSRRDARPN